MSKEETVTVDLVLWLVPAKHTDEGLRALSGESPIRPESIQKYLESKFGDALEGVSDAILELAKSFPPSELAKKPYALYEKFRPEISPGKKGWGPPGNWTWTSSARWLRLDPEELLFDHLAKEIEPRREGFAILWKEEV